MHSKINIHNFWRSHTFIILTFVIMSVLSAAILWHSKLVVTSGDFYFHWQRIYEMKKNIESGNVFSLVMLNMFNQTGTAVLAVYPVLNLIPIVFLSFIIKNVVTLIYIIFILRNFFALLIGYFCSYDYNHNKKVSFLFTVLYTLNTTVLYHSIYVTDLGRSSSIIFLPLVLFGFLKLIDSNKWVELSVGMSAIILCHVINSVIAILFLLCLCLFNLTKFNNKEIFKSLFKAIIITLLITSVFWVPFFTLMLNNKISMPPFPAEYIVGNHIWSLVSSFRNRISPSISLMAFLGLLYGILEYKKMNLINKKFLWLSIIFLFLCSNLFPWPLLSHTFIKDTLQYPYRFFIIPQLLLCYILSENVLRLVKNKRKQNYFLIIGLLLALCTQLLGQEQIVYDAQHNGSEITNNYVFSGNKGLYLTNNNDMNILCNNINMDVDDYYPQASLKYAKLINHHFAVYGTNNYLKTNSLGNGEFLFNSPRNIDKLSLPFLYYHGINYQVMLDGKMIKSYSNKNALMTINQITKGKHYVKIIVKKSKFEIISYCLTAIGIVTLVFLLLKKWIKKL